ncbi:hypothetical protein RI444_09325 [Paenarthrobacter sp. AT5]|nr:MULTISPECIES: hypothetical protein [Paenarthrobacter]WOC62793.1 hypothetical protein RI444_09325 [Paenarthrobacter sp. AT5]
MTRTKKDGSQSFTVRWRDPKIQKHQGITVATQAEAETLKRLLDANGQNFEIAQHAILENAKRVPTVAEVIQEHIDMLVRPSSGTVKNVPDHAGFAPAHGHRRCAGGQARLPRHCAMGEGDVGQGSLTEDHKDVHGLISASMNTAEMLGYIARNPCRGVHLPSVEKAEDEMMFLTHAEFGLIMDCMGRGIRTSQTSW